MNKDEVELSKIIIEFIKNSTKTDLMFYVFILIILCCLLVIVVKALKGESLINIDRSTHINNHYSIVNNNCIVQTSNTEKQKPFNL